MALYRASAADGVAWVTGASTGIGRHLALDLAKNGYTVAVTARREERLTELAREAASLAGRILPFPCDVTDEAGMRRTVERIEAEAGPIVLAIFNAGAYFPVRGDALEAGNIIEAYRLNVFGVVYGMAPAVEHMARRQRGHIAVIGSVAAYGGLPMAAAYGASKAALNHMAASLKFDFDKMNIRIQIINPGFVDTPLTKNGKFPMPALMHAADAAERIVRALNEGGFEVTFPRRFTWLVKLLNLLPYPAYFAVVNRAMGWRKRPLINRRRTNTRP